MKYFSFKDKNKYIKGKNLLDECDFKNSLKLFNELLDKNYETFSILFNLITIHKKLNSLDILLNQIDGLLIDDNYNRADLMIHKGYIFYLKENYENAIKCFDEVLNMDSNNLWAYFYKCKVNHELKQDMCFNELFNMIKCDSADYYLLLLVGEFFLGLNMLNEALYCLNESIKKYSKDPIVWRDKGMVLNLMEKYQEAIDAFNISLNLKNNFIIWDLKGKTYYSMGDYKNSLKCFDESLKLYPNNLETLKDKMILLFEIDNLDESLAYCDKLLHANMDDVDLWNFKLDMLQKLKRYDELNSCYEKAVKRFPNDSNLKRM